MPKRKCRTALGAEGAITLENKMVGLLGGRGEGVWRELVPHFCKVFKKPRV
jgi:hypothetical protein